MLVHSRETRKKMNIKDYRRVAHLSMGKKHLSKYIGSLDCEGHPLHGKELIVESSVRVLDPYLGRYGKSKKLFYLSDSKETFSSLDELINHYL
jgi:hypothetical protein